jgi:hypothetical protein
MKPRLEDYKILSHDGHYHVLTPFDLFAMPAFVIIGPGFATKSEANDHIQTVYESNLREYHRLAEMGRNFPDND